jgi:20S proteasome subunit beta 4/signal peptidase
VPNNTGFQRQYQSNNNMDTVLGITYNGGVIIAADQSNGRSILTYQKNLDKIAKLTDYSMMGVSGPNCDLKNFTE